MERCFTVALLIGVVFGFDGFGLEPKERSALFQLSPVLSIAFSANGKMVASGIVTHSGIGDKPIKLLEVATGKERATLTVHNHNVYCVAFSPNGKTLAAGSWYSPAAGSWDITIKLWEVATGNERPHSRAIRHVFVP